MLPKSAKPSRSSWAVLTALASLATLALAAGARGDAPAPPSAKSGRRRPARPARPRRPAGRPPWSSTRPNARSPTRTARPSTRSPRRCPPAGSRWSASASTPTSPTADVAKHAREFGLKFPVALDRDGSIAARLGVKVTPEAVVLDADGKVRYQGRIDDQYAARGKRNAEPRRPATCSDAVAAVLAGRGGRRRPRRGGRLPDPGPPQGRRSSRPSPRTSPRSSRRTASSATGPARSARSRWMTYEQARKRADDIADQVAERQDAPLEARPRASARRSSTPRRSPTDEIATIAAWAEAGAPEGDPADLPRRPIYRDGWALGDPDLIVEASEDFAIPAEGGDIYRCFVIPTNLPEDKYISAIEYRPGNRKVVHHVLAYVDTTGQGRKRDEADPGLGYSCFSGPGRRDPRRPRRLGPRQRAERSCPRASAGACRARPTSSCRSTTTPAASPRPTGPGSASTSPGSRSSRSSTGAPSLNTDMKIPAGATNYRSRPATRGPRVGWIVPMDVTALAVTPHMHLLGRDMIMTVTYPDGRDQDLIRIDDWDFNWQNTYYFEKPIDLPKGSVLKVRRPLRQLRRNPRTRTPQPSSGARRPPTRCASASSPWSRRARTSPGPARRTTSARSSASRCRNASGSTRSIEEDDGRGQEASRTEASK